MTTSSLGLSLAIPSENSTLREPTGRKLKNLIFYNICYQLMLPKPGHTDKVTLLLCYSFFFLSLCQHKIKLIWCKTESEAFM